MDRRPQSLSRRVLLWTAILVVALQAGLILGTGYPEARGYPAPQPQTDTEPERALVDYRADISTKRYPNDPTIFMIGNVAFHHNGTFIECDSAHRYDGEDGEYRMEGFGQVIVNKDDTYIYGDRITYDTRTNLAKIYSPLLKLVNQDATMWVYNEMEFNTETSIGDYTQGGIIIQRDNFMESDRGIYNSDLSNITFVGNVAMRNDNYKMRTDSIRYDLDREIVTFLTTTYIWEKERDFLTADRGNYFRDTETYHFTRNSYAMTDEQEFWADTMIYLSLTREVIMEGNIQILDTTQNTLAFGDYGYYSDSLNHGMLTRMPSVIGYDTVPDPETGKIDSVFMRGDTIFFDSYPLGMSKPDLRPAQAPQIPMPGSLGQGEISFSPAQTAALTPEQAAQLERMLENDSLPEAERSHLLRMLATGELSLSEISGLSLPDTLRESILGFFPADSVIYTRIPDLEAAEENPYVLSEGEEELVRAAARLQQQQQAVSDSVPPIEPIEREIRERLIRETRPAPTHDTLPGGEVLQALGVESVIPDLRPVADPEAESNFGDTLIDRIPAMPRDTLFERIFDHPAPVPYDSLGNPIFAPAQYDSLGNPILAPVQYDSLGNPLPGIPIQYDSLGNPLFPAPAPAEPQDSLERVIRAYYNVKIYRDDVQCIADSVIAFSVDSTASLFGRPIIWNENNELTSDRIDIYTMDEKLDYALFTGDPFIVQQVEGRDVPDSLYNQAQSRIMEAWFEENEIARAVLTGNVLNHYYMLDDYDRPDKLTKVSAPNLIIDFEDREPVYLRWEGSGEEYLYPITNIPAGVTSFLPNFGWSPDLRPKSRYEITTRSIRPSERIVVTAYPLPRFVLEERISESRRQLLESGTWYDRNEPLRFTLEEIREGRRY